MTVRKQEEAELSHLLASFRGVGKVDSEGCFTMAGRQAAGKLAKSLLPDPADWILKVVQGACRAQADSLQISQTGKATHLEFRLPYRLDIKALEASLTGGAAASQPGIDELSAALRVVGLSQDRAWVARLRLGEGTTHWILVKDGAVSLETVSESAASDEHHTDVLIGIAFPPGQTGKLGGLVRFGAAVQNEHEALIQRARACPIPLTLDGMRLDTLQRSDGLGGLELEAFLGVACGDTPGVETILAPPGLREAPATWSWEDRFTASLPFLAPPERESLGGSSVQKFAFRYQREPKGRRGHTLGYRALPTPSRVVLVRHGVIVGRRNVGITEPIAIDVYLCADSARSDLSGLEVEVGPEHLETARVEIRAAGGTLITLAAHLESHRAKPARADLAKLGGVASAALLLAPWPAKLVALGLSAAALRASARNFQQVIADCREELLLFESRNCRTPDLGSKL